MRSLIICIALSIFLSFANANLIYEGRTLAVSTGQPNLAVLLRERADLFKNLTGATINVITRDFGTFFDDVKTDLLQGSPFFDAYVP